MDRLDNIVLQRLVDRQSRKQLVESIIQDCFCAYSSKEIRDCVKRCVMEGLIQFQSRTGHLNEEAMLWRTS